VTGALFLWAWLLARRQPVRVSRRSLIGLAGMGLWFASGSICFFFSLQFDEPLGENLVALCFRFRRILGKNVANRALSLAAAWQNETADESRLGMFGSGREHRRCAGLEPRLARPIFVACAFGLDPDRVVVIPNMPAPAFTPAGRSAPTCRRRG